MEQLRTELKETRQQHRDEREQLRSDHLAQLADAKQAAAERVDALTAALRAAEQVSEALRRQFGDDDAEQGAGESTGTTRSSSRKARGSEEPK